ncbi:SDR family NAD(P)-dependent oxidoreductase [Subtercola endophyticus]|uniref:SDR family NAD(P)-dependent oxidoreductase n=1 Tax=Subtercola endophyticus TaxID=2895559 RepID=UPI001E4E0502|nr:glucose 1-dehydrogenase [Subtercola endophyticus]UFS60179.1 glucose 1-dehydrogenase [Subtercola endophyticus]
MGRLDGKVALITGAAKGMGARHAEVFVREGAKVIVADLDVDAGTALVERLGEAAIFARLDVTDPGSWASVVADATERLGHIDVLVNNAGVSGTATQTAELTDREWDTTINIDLNGTFYGVRAVIPQMIENGGGSIVNISSAAGLVGTAGVNVGYVAAKFAVRGIAKQVAIEYGGQGIRANSVHPGAVRTDMTQALIDQLGPEWEEGFYSGVPMHRIAELDEVSNAVLFLASDESSFITGTELVVDGGLVAQ